MNCYLVDSITDSSTVPTTQHCSKRISCMYILSSAKNAGIFYEFCNPTFSQSEKDRHSTFVWKYFDRGISKSSKGVTDEKKCKNFAAVITCTGGSTSGLFRHLKNKHSMEKPSSTQSGVSSNKQRSDLKCS